MAYYTLKTIAKTNDYMAVLRETEDGYVVRIVRDKDGYDEITTDFISRTLFESCLRTGYLTKIEDTQGWLWKTFLGSIITVVVTALIYVIKIMK